MRLCTTISVIFLLYFTAYTAAWPHYINKRGLVNNAVGVPIEILKAAIDRTVNTLAQGSDCTNFYPNATKYPFVAPGPGDKRGPCPGLNAFANHGYLPRNGIVSAKQLLDVCNCIASFTSRVSIALVGVGYFPTANILLDQMSIGDFVDNPDALLPPVKNLGICHHTGIERDGSLMRTDVGLGGNCSLNCTLWAKTRRYGEASSPQWKPDAYADVSYDRFLESYYGNPTFVWEGFQYITMVTTARIAWQTFPSGLGLLNPNTYSQYSWFVNETMPCYYKANSHKLSIADVLQFFISFFVRHPDPRWLVTFKVPPRPECYKCWWRSIVEDTYITEPNLLSGFYNLIASYSSCTNTNCTKSDWVTPTSSYSPPTPTDADSEVYDPYTTPSSTTPSPSSTTLSPTTTPASTPCYTDDGTYPCPPR